MKIGKMKKIDEMKQKTDLCDSIRVKKKLYFQNQAYVRQKL
jgi:hypothetical protein